MNYEEINKKFAIFIGGEYLKDEDRWRFNSMMQPCGSSAPNFHEDWNWLNKVRDKIEDINNPIGDYIVCCTGVRTWIRHMPNFYDSTQDEDMFEYNGSICKTSLQAAYKVFNDYIDYHNNLILENN